MNQRDQLVENFEDAFMALFMADVAEHEGEEFLEENERLKNDADFKVPPELDRRCLRTINKITRRKRALHTGKKVYRVFSKFSVAAVIALALFTSAYAAFPEIRVSTLNLLIDISDIATELKFGNSDDTDKEADSVEPSSTFMPDGAITFAGYVVPESITNNYRMVDEGSDQFASWVSISNDSGSLIYIEIQRGEGNSVNINTENAVAIEKIDIEGYKGLITEQDNMVIASVADITKTNFILITFVGTDVTEAIGITYDFLSAN